MLMKLFSIGPVTIYSYGLMVAIAVVSAVLLSMHRAKKRGLDPDHLFNMAFFGIITGIIGAKLMYYLVEIRSIILNPALLLDVSGGFVVYGGLVGLLTPVLYCRKKKIPFMPYLEMALPTVAMAQGIGRIGCFLAGCCYGNPTGSWIGVVFPADSLAPYGMPLIPTQLISSLGDFLIAAVLFACTSLKKKKPLAQGRVLGLYLLMYSVGRFIIEFFRSDPRGSFWIFSTSQWLSFVAFLMAIVWMLFLNARSKAQELKAAEAKVEAEMAAEDARWAEKKAMAEKSTEEESEEIEENVSESRVSDAEIADELGLSEESAETTDSSDPNEA